MGLFDKLKPRHVDSVTPTKELYDELKEHVFVVIVISIIEFVASIFAAGFVFISANDIITTFSSNVRSIKLTLKNCFIYGFQHLWLTLIITGFLIFHSFRLYRSIRRTYQKNYKDNYLKSKKETYGGAHFQTTDELNQNFAIYPDIENTVEDVYGTDESGNIYCLRWQPGMNKNELFYGSPGCGKSAAIVKNKIYQGIRRGVSLIVTDTKGDLYKETSAVARECGYRVRILNLKPKELRNSDGIDLFHSLNPMDDSIDIQADVVTNIIFNNTTGLKEVEDYWHKNEYNLVKMVILILVTEKPYIALGKNKLPEIYNFLAEHSPDSLEQKMSSYSEDSIIYKCYKVFAEADKKIQGQIINGAAIRLQKLANPILQKVLATNEMDPILPMKEKCIYYIVIPDQDNTFRFISQLYFTRTFMDQCDYSDSLTREEKKKQLPVVYVLDEYKNTGGIVGLPEKIATVRSRKIELTIILQDSNQLLSLYDEYDAATIKNCCVVKGMLSTNDPSTAKEFSELLGTQTIVVENLRYYEDAADIVHAQEIIQKTLGEGERPLMLPEEFMNGKMSRDEIIYAISGMPPVRLLKYFAEKSGEAIHPMEAWGMELGEKKTSKHKPRWRYLMEQEQVKSAAEQNANPMAGFAEETSEPRTTSMPNSKTAQPSPVPKNSKSEHSTNTKPSTSDTVDDFFGFEIS